MIMEIGRNLPNCVRVLRAARGWSQAELAQRAGISRAAVSAIEGRRLVPSVSAALALARVLESSVEELFGLLSPYADEIPWAWTPPDPNWRYWLAEIDGRLLRFPVEIWGVTANEPHDGCGQAQKPHQTRLSLARQTLVVACCDPAGGLLASLYRQATGHRMIVIPRSSHQALDLLERGVVHAAGLHLSTDTEDRNADAVRRKLGGDYRLLRVAAWQEGLAMGGDCAAKSVMEAVRSPLRWVGREPGSGARQCLDELLPRRIVVQHVARDHRGVADAIRSGWADVGVCLRLTCAEAGLSFLALRDEVFEFCFPGHAEADVRLRSLVRTVRSSEYRRLLADLPGYDPSIGGEIRCVT